MGLRYKEKRCISFGKDDTSYSLYLLDMLFLTKSEGLSPFRQKKGKHLVQKGMSFPSSKDKGHAIYCTD